MLWHRRTQTRLPLSQEGDVPFQGPPLWTGECSSDIPASYELRPIGLNFEVCRVYVGDVIVFSTTPEEHLERLEMGLKRFQGANLKLKLRKSFDAS